jgi:hypothetical protein
LVSIVLIEGTNGRELMIVLREKIVCSEISPKMISLSLPVVEFRGLPGEVILRKKRLCLSKALPTLFNGFLKFKKEGKNCFESYNL